jgi:hypothetical protein
MRRHRIQGLKGADGIRGTLQQGILLPALQQVFEQGTFRDSRVFAQAIAKALADGRPRRIRVRQYCSDNSPCLHANSH